MIKITSLSVAATIIAIMCGCRESSPPDIGTEFCGRSFCVLGVLPETVQTTNPVVDVTRHIIARSDGDIYILEMNHPDIDMLTRVPITELCHLRAWRLSPTPTPQALVLVGAKSPFWLIVSISGDDSRQRALVEFLQRLRITAKQDNWPSHIEPPRCS